MVSDAKVYTDYGASYRNIPYFDHESVNHSAGEYVRDNAGTQGIESFWSLLKRAYTGTFHKISPKHLHRYAATEFTGRHNARGLDTAIQIKRLVQ